MEQWPDEMILEERITPQQAAWLGEHEHHILWVQCVARLAAGEHDFVVPHPGASGVLRAIAVRAMRGVTFWLLKTTHRPLPALDLLGMPKQYIEHLLRPASAGLILIVEALRAERTTLGLASLLWRAKHVGGIGYAVETAPLWVCEGPQGKGTIFQVAGDQLAREVLPSLGSVRESAQSRTAFVDNPLERDLASHCLTLAQEGWLVLATMPAMPPDFPHQQAIQEFAGMAGYGDGAADREMAQALSGVLVNPLALGRGAVSTREPPSYLEVQPEHRRLIAESSYIQLGRSIEASVRTEPLRDLGAAARGLRVIGSTTPPQGASKD